jgi:hypothetical protein
MNSHRPFNRRATGQNRFLPTVNARFLFACGPDPAQFNFDGRYEPKRGPNRNPPGTSRAGALRLPRHGLAAGVVSEQYSTL